MIAHINRLKLSEFDIKEHVFFVVDDVLQPFFVEKGKTRKMDEATRFKDIKHVHRKTARFHRAHLTEMAISTFRLHP